MPTARLRALPLEPRDVPASVALGDGWADPTNLTLSFAADGTLIGQPPPGVVEVHTTTTAVLGTLGLSPLNRVLAPVTGGVDDLVGGLTSGPDSRSDADAAFAGLAWKRDVLRAFQTWVAATNVNLGLAADSMNSFGTAGRFQGDARFGDVRIGGTRLHPDALANAAVVSPDNGTWSGDVLFNTAANYGGSGYDLFTVALHEAGHVFGLEHSDDPASVMSEAYGGTRGGLAASDVATVQSYYGGPRRADGFDVVSGNDGISHATAVSAPGDFTLRADITTATDADWYRFSVPAGASFTATLDTRGLSLLTARLSVVDAAGREVRAVQSTDPTNGDLRVSVANAAGGTYFLKVAAAGEAFGVGRYQLGVSGLGGTPTDVTAGGPATSVAPPTTATENPLLASGTLTKSSSRHEFTHTLASSGLFKLEAEATANVGGVELIVEVFDATGARVLSFTRSADGTRGGKSAYLQAGRYTVRTTAVIPLLAFGGRVQFGVFGGVESDPMGTYRPTTSTSPYPTSPPPTTQPPSPPPPTNNQTTAPPPSSSTAPPYRY